MKKKLLIIDDDSNYLEELSEALSLRNFYVVEVYDSSRALEAVALTLPDLIMLDLKMPVKTGVEVSCELKKIKEFSNIPIIAMSGFLKQDYTEVLEACGISSWLKKPFCIDEAVEKISELLSREDKSANRLTP